MTYYNGIHISGNFNKLSMRKPKNWIERGYKILVPYRFRWREKIGKVECDCKECEEHYQAYYGISWYHSKDCAMMKYVDAHPQILNLNQYRFREIRLIASTD